MEKSGSDKQRHQTILSQREVNRMRIEAQETLDLFLDILFSYFSPRRIKDFHAEFQFRREDWGFKDFPMDVMNSDEESILRSFLGILRASAAKRRISNNQLKELTKALNIPIERVHY